MTDPVIIHDFAEMQEYRGPIGPHVEFLHGPIAVDALAHATAEEVLHALRGSVPLATARAIVALLDDNGLLFVRVSEMEHADAR